MKRMMAPTTALDTISKIRMVLTAWVMVMRIVNWAVFSVQMSFERFRTGQVDLLFFSTLFSFSSQSTKVKTEISSRSKRLEG